MTSLLATLLVVSLVVTNARAISSRQEFAAVQTAWFGISNVLNWAKGLKALADYDFSHGVFRSSDASVALGDCVKLYEASLPRLARLVWSNDYSHDDAVTWLSAALASNRGCLEGLKEKGLFFDTNLALNLTWLLERALGFMKEQANNTRVPSTGSSEQDLGLLASWNPGSSKADLVVAQDGSGHHKNINGALKAVAAMGANRPHRTIIYVKSGVYNEQVNVDSKLNNLMFVGDGSDRTIVTDNKNVADGASTLSSTTFGVFGDGFWARDMTFENTAGPEKQQAVALGVHSDLSVFYRCSIKGYQDSHLVWQLRQFYRDCQIYGTVDFIFGDAAAVFQNCDIIVRRPLDSQGNVITAQGRENPNENTGIVVMDSRVLPDADFALVEGSFKSYLGRPWRGYARVVFIRTDLDDLVDPEGWEEWNGDFALSTLYFAEYRNTGKGANTANRVKWPGFHLLQDSADVDQFSARNFFQGDLWIPATGVPFSADIRNI